MMPTPQSPRMRLRLRIERNALPLTQALWPVKDKKSTIAQLLQSINDVFPLEADTWGLEDYTVSVGGYECLHYHELATLCKDDDELTIKPLQYTDVRARAMAGRDQIAPDGRHMIDGVPFGRPCLKGPVRPKVDIPPRKKRRVSGDGGEVQLAKLLSLVGEGANKEDSGLDGMIRNFLIDNGEELGVDEDDRQMLIENREKLRLGEPQRKLLLTENGEESDETDDEDFEQDDASDDDAESVEDSDESEDSDTSSDDSDESESDSISESDSEDAESWDGLPASDPPTPEKKTKPNLKNGTAHSASPPETSQSLKRKRQTDDESAKQTSSPMNVDKTPKSAPVQSVQSIQTRNDSKPLKTAPVEATAPPSGGQSKTKSRNHRRRDAKKLKHLKEQTILPQDATLADLHEWENDHPDEGPLSLLVDKQPYQRAMTSLAINVSEGADSPVIDDGPAEAGTNSDTPRAGWEAKQSTEDTSNLMPSTDDGHMPVKTKAKKMKKPKESKDQDDFERQRGKLLDNIAAGGVDVTPKIKVKKSKGGTENLNASLEPIRGLDAPANNDHRQKSPPESNYALIEGDNPADSAVGKTSEMVPRSVAQRSKLDLSTSQRLVFGSLGVRVPKTQDEKDKMRQKLADRAKRNVNAEPGQVNDLDAETIDAQVVADVQEDDDELWRDKIHLTAVECCDADIVNLSTPPFPFHQRWDPQQRKKKQKANKRVNGSFMDAAAGKKRKRPVFNDDFAETYDKYFDGEEGDGLNYDDEEDDGYWEEGALLDRIDDGEDDKEDANEDDGFPRLPIDINELDIVNEDDARGGDFVVFSELACDEKTGWEPRVMTRTAKLWPHSPEDSHWMLTLSARDRMPRLFDSEGNRIYSKFEMPDAEADAENGIILRRWDEMGVVRLVLRPMGNATAL